MVGVDEDLKAIIAGANGPGDPAFIVRLSGGWSLFVSACVGGLRRAG